MEIDGKIFYEHVKDAVKLMHKLNAEAGLDHVKCFEELLPQIKKDLAQHEDTKLMTSTSNACYKFADDCHYSDLRYKGYTNLKKITREYYS